MKPFGQNGRKKTKVFQYTRVGKSLVPIRPNRPKPTAPDDPLGIGLDDLCNLADEGDTRNGSNEG